MVNIGIDFGVTRYILNMEYIIPRKILEKLELYLHVSV